VLLPHIVDMTEEHVVLVSEQNEVLGTLPKKDVHGAQTPLHRGFSVFLFRPDGMFLLQQRAYTKQTWGGAWSNSCCGHPALDESVLDAARRRLKFELGITDVPVLTEVAPYQYCFVRDGVMENEICPILVGVSAAEPQPNPTEVEAVRWISWQEFVDDTRNNPGNWSDWCVEETQILINNPEFHRIIQAQLTNS